METQNSVPKNSPCNLDQNTCDAGNALIAMFFGFTGLIYFFSGDWLGALTWICLGAACALVIGVPRNWRENWKSPRALVSISLSILAIALLLFAPSRHQQSHTEASANPALTATGAK
jgi:hypothetical protein